MALISSGILKRHPLKYWFVGFCLFFCQNAVAVPGTIHYSDNFERASLGPTWVASSPAISGISSQAANSPTRSMFTSESAQSLTTTDIDLSGLPGAALTLWVRRGADAFSEDPDNGENLVIEYKDTGGSFVIAETLLGAGTPGEVINIDFSIPLAELHSGFQLRIRQTGGSGSNFDFWHIDDIIITETDVEFFSPDFCDDFERATLGDDWSATAVANSGISTQTANTPTRSMFSRAQAQSLTSRFINLSSTSNGNLSMWIRRGDDAFSENPDGGEDLVIEYRNNGGGYTVLQTLPGNGTPGEVSNLVFALPADAFHGGFQIRFRQIAASNGNFDYWHMDDVCITDTVMLDPNIEIVLTADVTLVAPSGLVNYTMTVTNVGPGQAANVVVDGIMPLFTSLNLDTYGAGVAFDFTEGTSTLFYGVEDFSMDDGVTYGYVPASEAGGAAVGFDGLLTNIRITTMGLMPASSSFTIDYQVQVD
ncbi:MAG: putative repeat protein (TIGR01451 family) [Granulosicoccus sp.]|jgi:uncharacterized repeat protein (TIGR01451 family)